MPTCTCAELRAPHGASPAGRVEERLARVDEEERRRLVAACEARRPAEWREICRDVRDVALAERALVFAAVEATISEWAAASTEVLALDRANPLLRHPSRERSERSRR